MSDKLNEVEGGEFWIQHNNARAQTQVQAQAVPLEAKRNDFEYYIGEVHEVEFFNINYMKL